MPDGSIDKARFVPLLEQEYNVNRKDMAYIGDDIVDQPIMDLVGMSLCPENAHPDVDVHIRLPKRSGDGVVLEFLMLLRKYRNQ